MSASVAPLLREVVGMLREIGVPHMVVGSFASMFHGEPRTTLDLDLVIDPTRAQLEQLLTRLPPDHYYVDPEVARSALVRRSMFNIIDMNTAWKLDMIIRKARPFSIEELGRRQPQIVFGVEVDTATPEDTIIAKLEWAKAGSSERQLRDVAGIVRSRADKLDTAYIERWVEELGLRDVWEHAQRL